MNSSIIEYTQKLENINNELITNIRNINLNKDYNINNIIDDVNDNVIDNLLIKNT